MITPFFINAKHIFGGFMTYEYIGSNEYSFEMRLYRDCDSDGAEFDDPARIAFYKEEQGLYLLIWEKFVPLSNPINVISASEDDCMNEDFPFCIEEGVYNFQSLLFNPSMDYSVHVIYQRCCKNVHFNNIADSDVIGITLTTELAYEALQLKNNSAILSNNNFFKTCVGEEFNFDISANDIDSNQIVYELCTPILGGGIDDIDMPNGCDGVQPIPACPPPFKEVDFIMPTYSVTSPLGTNSILELDSETGEISGVANIVGQFLVGVCVKEYDNGVLISESHQDLVFRVDYFLDASEPNVEKLSIYPNPSKEIINIELPNQFDSFQLSVRDINGKLIKYIPNILGSNYELNLQDLKGLYFLELQSSNKFYYEKMIVL